MKAQTTLILKDKEYKGKLIEIKDLNEYAKFAEALYENINTIFSIMFEVNDDNNGVVIVGQELLKEAYFIIECFAE